MGDAVVERTEQYTALRGRGGAIVLASSRHTPTLGHMGIAERTALVVAAFALAEELCMGELRIIAKVGRRAGQRTMHAHVCLLAAR